MTPTLLLKRTAVALAALLWPIVAAYGRDEIRSLQLPAFKVGPPIRFSYQMSYWNEPSGPHAAMSETFDIQVLDTGADGARIVWTLRSSAQSPGDSLYDAIRDIPIELDVDPAGKVLDVANFDGVKNQLLGSRYGSRLSPAFSRDDTESEKGRIEGLMSEILLEMSVMQPHDTVPFGHNILSPIVKNYGMPGLQYTIARTMDLRDVDNNYCRAKFLRHTIQTCRDNGAPCETPEDAVTSATVSTADGWIIESHRLMQFAHFKQTTDIHRLTPAVCQSPI